MCNVFHIYTTNDITLDTKNKNMLSAALETEYQNCRHLSENCRREMVNVKMNIDEYTNCF